MSLATINDRLDLVEEMIEYPQLRQDTIALLEQTFDSLRLVTKFTYGRGDADDLMELSKTIATSSDLFSVIHEHTTSRNAIPIGPNDKASEARRRQCMSALERRFDLEGVRELARRIQDAIDEDALSEYHRVEDEQAEEMSELAQDVLGREAGEEDLKNMPKRIQPKAHAITGSYKSATDGRDDIWIMKRNASPVLNRLHKALDSMTEAKADLEAKLRQQMDVASLTLKWTPNLAHIAHVKGKDVSRVTPHFPKSLSSSKSTRSFQVPEWTQLGAQMDETRFRIRSEEQRVLGELREGVVRNLVRLRRNAAVLDELDVACAFSILAVEKNFIRPILTSGTSHNIVGGRHPVVESSSSEQGRKFTPNDCILDDKERIWLITGPNMAGKSTYLRQNALISILAQTGSFVPAEYAEIGLVDKVFSRVGSADNLFLDQSTFMVEMLETAQILKEATPRSFVIMDEVGRGTTPEDGIAVGYACLHHLYHINQCRTLFATHFHALTDMTKDFDRLACYCNDVREEVDGKFSYVHRLKKGVNRESHALKVARVAGELRSRSSAIDLLTTLRPPRGRHHGRRSHTRTAQAQFFQRFDDVSLQSRLDFRAVQHVMYHLLYTYYCPREQLFPATVRPTSYTHYPLRHIAAHAARSSRTHTYRLGTPLVTAATQAARFITFCIHSVIRAAAEYNACGVRRTRLSSSCICTLNAV